MNARERKLVDHLKYMRDVYGVIGVKAEFEAEGTRLAELQRLKDVSSAAGLPITLKIGGPEDIWGILQARLIGVSTIVAPMIESAYSLGKFLAAVGDRLYGDELTDLVVAINIETIRAFEDLDSILRVGSDGGLQCVTVGRVDFVGSMGLSRDKINSHEVFEKVMNICDSAKKAGMMTAMGGGIEPASFSSINTLVGASLLDKFETRKVVFNASQGIKDFNRAIIDAHRFELTWLENKRAYYNAIADEDKSRIEMIRNRVEQGGS
ncbi:MAG: aldolase/citrate lyase family protein [bacterium]|nr:aldolase/citrate lyase family protein [bacterium]